MLNSQERFGLLAVGYLSLFVCIGLCLFCFVLFTDRPPPFGLDSFLFYALPTIATLGALIISIFCLRLPYSKKLQRVLDKETYIDGVNQYCAYCKYDLTGSIDSDRPICPECGKEVSGKQIEIIKDRPGRHAGSESTSETNR